MGVMSLGASSLPANANGAAISSPERIGTSAGRVACVRPSARRAANAAAASSAWAARARARVGRL